MGAYVQDLWYWKSLLKQAQNILKTKKRHWYTISELEK